MEPGANDRPLEFYDDRGHKKAFLFEDGGHLAFSIAFEKFFTKYLSEDNAQFRIVRVLTDEILYIDTAQGIIGRSQGPGAPEITYRRYEREQDGADLRIRFASSGFAALDKFGPWTSDRESLLREPGFANFELANVLEKQRYAERRREIKRMPKLDRKALGTFCKLWADTGYNEYISDSEVYYVLFDSREVDEVEEQQRLTALSSIAELGLELVATPAASSSGEIWVRTDPRVDLELENWG